MSKYRIGKRVKIAHVDWPGSVWRVGDEGVVEEHDAKHGGAVFDVKVRMRTVRNGSRYSYGNDEYYVPITEPPLREKLKLLCRKPSTDTTPGSWAGTGFDPNKAAEKEKEDVAEKSE